MSVSRRMGNWGEITFPWFRWSSDGRSITSSQKASKSGLFLAVSITVLAPRLWASSRRYNTSSFSPLMLTPKTRQFSSWNTPRIRIMSLWSMDVMSRPIRIKRSSISLAARPELPVPQTNTRPALAIYRHTLSICFSFTRLYVLFRSSW